MSKLDSFFLYYTRNDRTVCRVHTTVTPHSQVIGLRLPFAALIWHRPTGITIGNLHTGQKTYHPILDITRLVIWGFYGILLCLWVYTTLLKKYDG